MTQQIPMSFRRTTSDLSSPVGDSSPTHYHNTSNTDNMVRSSSAEPAKTTKRKGTRSVSTLTPSQLARKRANDREAQRAIRARTKEHIERLERELEELKSKQSRDQTVQELLRRNKALEEELMRLKETMGVSMTSSPYSTPVYDDNLSSGSGAIPSPRGSPFPSGDYNSLPDYGQQYVPLPNNCESWANTVPCPVPSNVSSPSSSADDYSAGYIPTSVPASMLPSNNTSTSSINAVGHKDVIKMEYEEVDHHVSRRRVPPQQSLASARHPPYLHATATPPASTARVEHVSGLLPPGAVLGSLKGHHTPSSPGSWPVPVLTTAPACRFDELLVGFLQDCRRMTTAESIYQTLGPAAVDVRSLFRSHDAQGQLPCSPHPITDLIRSLVDIAGMTRLTERIAIFAPLQTLVCWLAHPTAERRARVGEDYLPREKQLSIRHPQWIDLVLWGGLREAMIDQQGAYATEEFQRVYFDSLRLINWPYQPLDGLVTDPQTGHVGLTDALMAHAMNGANWRLSEAFAQRYPELVELVEVESQ
ncbi:hypothetical protein NCS57_00898600 [Fusarium keratoplasticum]|uniref:Uncharacterized protein n=1 Tax=Fusarium keratoplasticum TaxID=1328300 RepID=A0ACC0QVM2_9HYPO|nr:hypothetical protein NCS57_00898600 [Fusarium keratoplasticum]KAI8666724.1 hypothetical protein NCS57_00898600 [Fusarium keratoplasticum]